LYQRLLRPGLSHLHAPSSPLAEAFATLQKAIDRYTIDEIAA
jgi:hypothetical protein